MSNISLSDFVLNNVDLRKLATDHSVSKPGEYDLFDAESREKCMWDVLDVIRSSLAESDVQKEVRNFLCALVVKCQDTVMKRKANSPPKKAKKPKQQRPTVTVAAEDTVMEAEPTSLSWADMVEEEANSKVAQTPKPRSKSRSKSKAKKAEKPEPKPKAQPKAKGKAAPRASRTTEKERVWYPRSLVPADFPVISDAKDLLALPVFNKDHTGEPIFTERTVSDREVFMARQGDWHKQGTCALCDTIRCRVQYFKSISGKDLPAVDWLVKPSAYEFRLLVLAHAFKISASIDFNLFTNGGKLLNVDLDKVHPTLESKFIYEADGTLVTVPHKLGLTPRELARKNHRYGLAELKKSLAF